MFKIFFFIFIIIINTIIQAAPYQDIMVGSSRLHRGDSQFYPRFNSIPDIKNIPSNNFIPHYRRNINNARLRHQEEEEEEPETVIVNMKIDSDEEPETQYVNLVIDTK